MNDYFVTSSDDAISVYPVLTGDFSSWVEKQNAKLRNWLSVSDFKARSAEVCLFPGRDGKIKQVYFGIGSYDDLWAFGALPNRLPDGVYHIKGPAWKRRRLERIAVIWGLGTYKFTEYKKGFRSKAKLLLQDDNNIQRIANCVDSIFLARDLINCPTENMGPVSLAKATTSLALEYGASVEQVIGDDLVKAGYNGIHMVGRGSAYQPRLIDMRWGKEKNPKIVLVGKGVCFDSGGLNLKPGSSMAQMKQDMAGAAYALALAKMIMASKLPVCLRVLIPAVENMVSGNSYKPGDVIKTYKGISVENTNTDAEGRLILADALTLACEDKPELLIDFATLTGAARIALGLDITALFTEQQDIADKVLQIAKDEQDPIWQLPLFKEYLKLLDSDIADMCNSAKASWGGAIIAALFLRKFVADGTPWLHFDIADYNDKAKPGRPRGAEVNCLRALFNYLDGKYSGK